MNKTTISLALAVGAVAVGAARSSARPAPPANPGAVMHFESKVRPLLSSRCFSCHSKTTAMGGLDLTNRETALKGGRRGSALSIGNPAESLLVKAVKGQGGLKMPPGSRLSTQEIAALSDWVRDGAGWGVAVADRPASAPWALRPPAEPQLPAVRSASWVKNPVDRFVLTRLELAGIRPNPQADRRTLIRRVTFDLTGLPPTPEEVDSFLGDTAPGAWDRLVDRLLASPAYGERWGRHWLDVVRYSDSNGFDWNEVFGNAWRYRDYVIQSFNEDKPYDRFLVEQLAGDLLPAANEAERSRNLIATGVLVMGPKLLAQQDRKQLALDVADEQIDVTTRGFLGLTASCARCHDHKFDPIPTRDYYALAGIFKSTATLAGTLPRNNRVMYWMERPLSPPTVVEAWKAHESEMKKVEAAMKKAKTPDEKSRLTDRMKTLTEKAPTPPAIAMAVQDSTVVDMRVHIRGSHKNQGDVVPRGVLAALNTPVEPIPVDQSGRLQLARWIANSRNPLTARVMANRIWLHHFGQGIVPTPDNFGNLGEKPTHPELLDWLALRFVEGGWSIKRLHKLILSSATYQMSSDPDPRSVAKDPENTLYWRANRRRLEAEAIRDAILVASGELDRAGRGGTLVDKTVGFPGKEYQDAYLNSRRSVYLPVIRGGLFDMFQVFDFADPHVVNGKRSTTTVAPQALLMMNSPVIRTQAGKMAEVLGKVAPDDATRVAAAYERILNRAPSASEVSDALRYLDDYARSAGDSPEKRAAWISFSRALFSSTEFRYVD